jgi:hypothetical protein
MRRNVFVVTSIVALKYGEVSDGPWDLDEQGGERFCCMSHFLAFTLRNKALEMGGLDLLELRI